MVEKYNLEKNYKAKIFSEILVECTYHCGRLDVVARLVPQHTDRLFLWVSSSHIVLSNIMDYLTYTFFGGL